MPRDGQRPQQIRHAVVAGPDQRDLRPRDHHRFAQRLQHETQGRRRVRHGVGPVQNDKGVERIVVVHNVLGHAPPIDGRDVAGIQQRVVLFDVVQRPSTEFRHRRDQRRGHGRRLPCLQLIQAAWGALVLLLVVRGGGSGVQGGGAWGQRGQWGAAAAAAGTSGRLGGGSCRWPSWGSLSVRGGGDHGGHVFLGQVVIGVVKHGQTLQQLGQVPTLAHVPTRGRHHANGPTGVEDQDSSQSTRRVRFGKPTAVFGFFGGMG